MGKSVRKVQEICESFSVVHVDVFIKGRSPHREYYKFRSEDYFNAVRLGFLPDEIGFFNKSNHDEQPNFFYVDWSPLEVKRDGFVGGLKYVHRYTSDDKYIYAHTSEDGVYSVRKELFKKSGSDYIFVGNRISHINSPGKL